MSQISASSSVPNDALSSQALAAHEAVMSLARRHNLHSIGALTTQLTQRGFGALAKRIRASARVRCAHTHPDSGLASGLSEAIGNALPQAVKPPSVAAPDGGHFDPRALQDDRLLRRKRLPAAPARTLEAPVLSRIASVEHQVDRILEPRLGLASHLQRVCAERHAQVMEKCDLLSSNIIALETKFDECFESYEEESLVGEIRAEIAAICDRISDSDQSIAGELVHSDTRGISSCLRRHGLA